MKKNKMKKRIVSLFLVLVFGMMGTINSYASVDEQTITNDVTDNSQVQPRVNVRKVWQETPPIGSSGDYNKLIDTYDGSNTFTATIDSLTISALMSFLLPHLGVSNLANVVAQTIINGAIGFSTNNLYYTRAEWGYKNDSWSYRQVIYYYYYDADHNRPATVATSYYTQYFY